jgi:predicted SnoaL-like aldol condensation-catalyzing enzyme
MRIPKKKGGWLMRFLLAEGEAELSNALTLVLRRNNYSADAVCDGREAFLSYFAPVLKTSLAYGKERQI